MLVRCYVLCFWRERAPCWTSKYVTSNASNGTVTLKNVITRIKFKQESFYTILTMRRALSSKASQDLNRSGTTCTDSDNIHNIRFHNIFISSLALGLLKLVSIIFSEGYQIFFDSVTF